MSTDLAYLHLHLKNTKLRLKSKYSWDDDFINMAVSEYGRFLTLIKQHPEFKIVPGKVVDEVWHDHILHTKSYTAYCATEFGEYLHHEPNDASSPEVIDMKPTLQLYEKTFGYAPPKAFWLDEVKTKSEATTSSGCRSGCRGCYT